MKTVFEMKEPVRCIVCGTNYDKSRIGYCPYCNSTEYNILPIVILPGSETITLPKLSVEIGYEPLANILQEALDQAQYGKGKKCHSNGKPFLEQPIIVGGKECGEGGLAFQARKKILEALNCEDDSRAIEDLLGAINYTAAMIIIRREKVGGKR